MAPARIFLLSPAHCGGERARVVLNPRAEFDLARRLRSAEGAPLGEVFSFLSGLYFRGKLAYARAFAAPPAGSPGVLVITTSEGLLPPDEPTTIARMKRFGRVDIDETDRRYRAPLLRDARALADTAGESCEVVLLGSVATGKYVDVLCRVLGDRLLFPSDFVGRGDMSRGGLMLRRAASGEELPYVPVAGAVRHGPRPPKLPRLPRQRLEPSP
ncbi:MAG: hypothetical protein M3542_09475 [Acidobacteriota bacterium]|nr:hypothetical protein [Acidobacteriota bacterium]MDQ5870730.1 hypothetical protein [Acidobacteriota bacterium]